MIEWVERWRPVTWILAMILFLAAWMTAIIR